MRRLGADPNAENPVQGFIVEVKIHVLTSCPSKSNMDPQGSREKVRAGLFSETHKVSDYLGEPSGAFSCQKARAFPQEWWESGADLKEV